MEFTLSYCDIKFCTSWCNKVASMKTCHLILLHVHVFLTDMFWSNDKIELESCSKSYWVDWYLSDQLFSFFMILCTCVLSFELVFITITGKKVRNLVTNKCHSLYKSRAIKVTSDIFLHHKNCYIVQEIFTLEAGNHN